jgi:SpoVK/Ycf46/Vps4 family AAA+-type ATPase
MTLASVTTPPAHPVTTEEFGAALHSITPGSVFGAYLGESERRLRDSFEGAAAQAADGQLAIVFLDEVDALCPRRGPGGGSSGSNQHEARVVAQLLTLLDGAAALEDAAAASDGGGGAAAGGRAAGRLVVVAATNRPNALDPALRRPGRLDREVAVSVPDAGQRAAILRCVWLFLKAAVVCWGGRTGVRAWSALTCRL